MPRERKSGIYKITNTATGKVYIGSSIDIHRRFYLHRWALVGKRHNSILLQRAWDKYGSEAFRWQILLFCEPERLIYFEQACIDFFRAADPDHGMNVAPEAGRPPPNDWTPERRKALSELKMGKPIFKNNPEAHARMMAAVKKGKDHHMYGRKHTPESIAKIKASKAANPGRTTKGQPSKLKGLKRSDEERANMSAARRAKSKMTAEGAREIRRRAAAMQPPYPRKAWAEEFGVTRPTVDGILAGASWVNV